jgi:hypothetical protein
MTTPDAAPAPASTSTPIVSDAVRLVRVLFSPGAVFEELKTDQRWWGAWLVVGIATGIINFLNAPFQAKVRQIMIERSGRPVPAGASGTMSQVLGFVTAPIGVLIFALVLAALLYMLMVAFASEASYKKSLLIVFFGWPIVLIQQVLTFVVLKMRGVDAINSPQDMMVSLGADLLLPADAQVSTFLRLVLAGIGPLQIWSAAIIATGIIVLGKAQKGGAWTATIIYLVITTLVVAGLGSFFFKMMGG